MWTVAFLIVSVLSLYSTPIICQVQLTDVKVLERGDDWQCASTEERGRARSELHQVINSVIATMLPATTFIPSTTTSAPMPTTASVTTQSTTQSTTSDCGGPGWRHIVFINMTNTSYNCPTGLRLGTSHSKRTCGGSHTRAGCSSATFSVGGLPYSCVCGRIRGYQVGTTSAFYPYITGIDNYYVSGVSLTHGGASNRHHIWTFAAGISEVTTRVPRECCPCDYTAASSDVPAFVGNDYFCESGLHSEWSGSYGVHYPDDVLWDGLDCTSTSTCCQFNNPPWFIKNLPTATTDDIELRICTPNSPSNADVPLELIELYIQ